MTRLEARWLWLFLVCIACGERKPPVTQSKQPHVEQWLPGDELTDTTTALRIVFDRPMVSIEQVGPVLEPPPVSVVPAAPLRVHWEDRQTLIVAPAVGWTAVQHYTFSLDPQVFRSVIAPRSYELDVLPLRLMYTSLGAYQVSRTPTFELDFSTAVDRAAVAEHCVLVSERGERTGLRLLPTPEGYTEQPSIVYLAAAQQLALAARYHVDCPGLRGTAGDAAFRVSPKVGHFKTHGPLAFVKGWPEPQPALPPERAELCLELTTEVDEKQLAEHVHVSPEPEGLAQSWYAGRCRSGLQAEVQAAEDGDAEGEEDAENTEEDEETRYSRQGHRRSSVLLAPRRHYRVTVDPALTDTFGQQLGRAVSFELDTTDRNPGLWTLTGVVPVLEHGRAGHAAGTLNLASVELRCAQLTAAQVAAKLGSIDLWVNQAQRTIYNHEKPERAPWDQLGVSAHVETLTAAAAPNVAGLLALDLGASCATGTGRPGLAGLYALELAARAAPLAPREYQGDVPARVLANVTDLGVVAKRGRTSGLVWVTRLSTGTPVAAAEVELIDPTGHTLARGTTASNGLASFKTLPPHVDGELFSVRSGEDVAVVGTTYLWSDGLRGWQLGARTGYEGDVRLFVHTDRGVYRPGERVYAHGLVRQVNDRAPARVPVRRDVRLRLETESEVLFERNMALNDFGSFASTIDLPSHLAPGTYSLQLEAAGASEYFPITVAEFRPTRLELTGEPDKPEVLGAEQVQLALSARYLFGAPVSAADVHFTVERSAASIRAPGLEEFYFADHAPSLPDEQPLPLGSEGIVLEQDSKTDAQGRVRFTLDAEPVQMPMRYTLSVATTDAAQDRATRQYSVLAHSADRYVGARLERFVTSPNEPIVSQLVVIDRSGKRQAAEVDVELRNERWLCTDPLRGCRVEVKVLGRQTVQVGAESPARVSFQAGVTGRVHVRASVRDAAGRLSRTSASGFVWSGDGSGPYDDRVSATLRADRERYAVGGQAALALETPLAPAQLLVTSERAEVLSAAVVPRSAGLPSIALGAEAAPNVFVTATGMTPRAEAGHAGRPRLVSGVKELSVAGQSRALALQIALARTDYKPKERIEGDITVTHLGQPVAAEVAVAVVNESVLLLTGYQTPDPTRVFHAPRGLSVETFSNITQVVADPKSKAAVPETARLLSEGGEDGPGGQPELRNDYVAAAWIAPQLRTDNQGRVHFAFDAPTDLSAYRVMVVAAAKDDRVGSAETRLRVAQPIAAHLIAPRFVSRGDQLEIGALVHDTTGREGATTVTFRGGGLQLAQTSGEVVADPAGRALRVLGTVQDAAQGFIEVELHKGPDADRVKHTLAVRRPFDTDLRVLAHTRASTAKAALSWPRGIDPSQSQLEVTVDRAGLAALAPLLAMVMSYPFGCTEQTSAALDAIAAAPELTRSVLPELKKVKQLVQRVDEGVSRLMAARTSEGHFGLYPGMAPDAELTAMVLQTGLALKKAGYRVPQALVEGAAEVLSSALDAEPIEQLGPAALQHAAHSALLLQRAEADPSALLDRLLARREQLKTDGKAYLLRALALAGRPEAQRSPLRAAVVASDWLAAARDPEQPFASADRTTALALAALVADAEVGPETGPQLTASAGVSDRLAQWLIDRAADPEHYFSTRDVAEALSALSAWARRRHAGANDVSLTLAGKPLWSGKLAGAEVVTVTRSAESAAEGGEVALTADGDVSVSMRRRDVSPSAPKPAFSRGISLDRRYLHGTKYTPLDKLALGEIVLVELTLRAEQSARMLAIADPLPAGLEPLDPGLSTGRVAGCGSCEGGGPFDHLRRHDDRIEAFADHLAAGTHVVRYLARATTRGHFTAPAATATLMYLPDRHARSAVATLDIE